jgi:hypothetical protein
MACQAHMYSKLTWCYNYALQRVALQVNKALYESGRVLALKDSGKGFPVARPVGVLRWSLTTNDESAMPLTINCWPEEEGNGVMNVNIEYTLQVHLLYTYYTVWSTYAYMLMYILFMYVSTRLL